MTLTSTDTTRNRRPLKWTANEPEGWHVYTYTAECGCQIDATRFAANHFVMSNSAGYHEAFESYTGMQNEAALMIDDDTYHQFGWTLADGTVAQAACHLHPDSQEAEAGQSLVAELVETARADNETYFWQLADGRQSEVFSSDFYEAARVMAVCQPARFGMAETWLLSYQSVGRDEYGNWQGFTQTSAETPASLPKQADSYHSAKMLAAKWLAEQPA